MTCRSSATMSMPPPLIWKMLDRLHVMDFFFRRLASMACPFAVSRYFCNRLFGLSGMVISISFALIAGDRYVCRKESSCRNRKSL